MNNNVIISIVVILGVILITIGGYAVWQAYTPSQPIVLNPKIDQNQPQNNVSDPKVAVPTVTTDRATVPYISTVVVKGTVNPNGTATTYWYEYGETSTLGKKSGSYLVGSGRTTLYTPAYITGLRSNTNYYFRLVASNALGTVNGSTYEFKTNTTPPPQGMAPTTTTQSESDVTKTTANLQGKINPNGSETSFWFEYGTTSGLGSVTAIQSTGSGNVTLPISVSVSNLQPLTKYYFRLNAQNQFGTVNGQMLNFTTKGQGVSLIPVVNTTSANQITNSSAKLNAVIKTNGDTTIYWFEYSKDSALVNGVLTTPELSLNDNTSDVSVSSTINNLDSNTKYYFRSVAKNKSGTISGDVDSFTTKR